MKKGFEACLMVSLKKISFLFGMNWKNSKSLVWLFEKKALVYLTIFPAVFFSGYLIFLTRIYDLDNQE